MICSPPPGGVVEGGYHGQSVPAPAFADAVYDAYPGGKSWDVVPGQTGSGKKFHRNVISGVDFTAGCSRSGAGLYVPRRTLSQGNVVIRSPPPGFDEGSYQGQSVPAPSQICHNLSLAKQQEEKVTCAS